MRWLKKKSQSPQATAEAFREKAMQQALQHNNAYTDADKSSQDTVLLSFELLSPGKQKEVLTKQREILQKLLGQKKLTRAVADEVDKEIKGIDAQLAGLAEVQSSKESVTQQKRYKTRKAKIDPTPPDAVPGLSEKSRIKKLRRHKKASRRRLMQVFDKRIEEINQSEAGSDVKNSADADEGLSIPGDVETQVNLSERSGDATLQQNQQDVSSRNLDSGLGNDDGIEDDTESNVDYRKMVSAHFETALKQRQPDDKDPQEENPPRLRETLDKHNGKIDMTRERVLSAMRWGIKAVFSNGYQRNLSDNDVIEIFNDPIQLKVIISRLLNDEFSYITGNKQINLQKLGNMFAAYEVACRQYRSVESCANEHIVEMVSKNLTAMKSLGKPSNKEFSTDEGNKFNHYEEYEKYLDQRIQACHADKQHDKQAMSGNITSQQSDKQHDKQTVSRRITSQQYLDLCNSLKDELKKYDREIPKLNFFAWRSADRKAQVKELRNKVEKRQLTAQLMEVSGVPTKYMLDLIKTIDSHAKQARDADFDEDCKRRAHNTQAKLRNTNGSRFQQHLASMRQYVVDVYKEQGLDLKALQQLDRAALLNVVDDLIRRVDFYTIGPSFKVYKPLKSIKEILESDGVGEKSWENIQKHLNLTEGLMKVEENLENGSQPAGVFEHELKDLENFLNQYKASYLLKNQDQEDNQEPEDIPRPS